VTPNRVVGPISNFYYSLSLLFILSLFFFEIYMPIILYNKSIFENEVKIMANII